MDEIEDLKQVIEVRDRVLKELQGNYSKLSGKGKDIMSEDTLFKSKSMATLSEQVVSLIEEVEKRENLENQLTEAQAKLKAALNERKMMGSFRVSMDEVEAEMGTLRTKNRELQDKLQQIQKRLGNEQSGATQDQVASLMREADEHENRYKKKCGELDEQITKAKELNGRVVAAETRANEAQKKYDDCKRNYFKLREERERLKAELEKAKGEAATTSKAGAVNGTVGDAS